MPDYKTHSIHSEIVLKNINNKTYIDKEDMKRFSFGPDALITTDYYIFDYQHSHNTSYFFETLLKLIKENKLQDNSKVMSFLYGQLDHFVLDLTTHPLIYYMTEEMPSKYILKPHSLIEMWMSDYIMKKYNNKDINYLKNTQVINNELKKIIDELYLKIYKRNKIGAKYNKGINDIILFEKIRFSKSYILKNIVNIINLGDVFYNKDTSRVKKYLNLNKSILTNPISGEEFRDSFLDLWYKSINVSLELINDVNNYLYNGKSLNNYLIKNNISYNTGFPCVESEEFKYVKKYKIEYRYK